METAEVAIFLGAGASRSEGAPTQAQLLAAFFRESFEDYYQILEGQLTLQSIRVLKNGLARFFTRFFGFDPTVERSVLFPTFEEVLGILDLALSKEEGFLGFSGNISRHQEGATLRNVRRDFVSLIALILDKTLATVNGHHTALINNLNRLGLLNSCAFVSFNYDILIDNALGRLLGHESLDYGIVFKNRSAAHSPTQPLLKLHGSLNWLYCPTCRAITLTQFEKQVSTLLEPSRSLCDKCSSMNTPIIVPPTYFKVFSNLFLQNVWHRAEQVLRNTRTWVFCGYSFPDADMHVKYLLKRVQVNDRIGLRRAIVVNWFDNKDSHEENGERERFLRFLGGGVRLQYERVSFEQFAADPQSLLMDENHSAATSLE